MKMDFMPADFVNSKYVHRAFRLVNMALSENVYRKWYKYVESNLQCMQTDRKNIDLNNEELSSNATMNVSERLKAELDELQRKDMQMMSSEDLAKHGAKIKEVNQAIENVTDKESQHCQLFPYLMHHEFLFLYSNCHYRFHILNKHYKTDLTSKENIIFEWELAEGKLIKDMKRHQIFRKLHLVKSELSDNMKRHKEKNRKYCIPNTIIQANLDEQMEHKNIKITGLEPKDVKTIEEEKTWKIDERDNMFNLSNKKNQILDKDVKEIDN